jgi:hypothetical protein
LLIKKSKAARPQQISAKNIEKNSKKLKQNRHQKRNNTPTQKTLKNDKKETIPILIRENNHKKSVAFVTLAKKSVTSVTLPQKKA